jgi:hypothetical protein
MWALSLVLVLSRGYEGEEEANDFCRNDDVKT